MPRLWRYYLIRTCGYLALITCAMIALLGMLRPEDLTRFAAISSTWWQLGTYLFVLVPYLLPVALPLASAITCAIICAQMAARGEWLALTSAGISPRQMMAPLLSAMWIVGAINAFIASETIEAAHRQVEAIRWDLAALKPLRALQPGDPLEIGRIAVVAEGRDRELVSDIIFGYLSAAKGRSEPLIGLITAKKLRMKRTAFDLEDFAHIHFQAEPPRVNPETLTVQRAEVANIQSSLLRTLLMPNQELGSRPLDRLCLRSLIGLLQRGGNDALILSDLFRRIANGGLPIALGLTGMLGGCRWGLTRSLRAVLLPACLSTVSFLSIFLGKAVADRWPIALMAYLGLQLAVGLFSWRSIQRLRVL